MEANELAVARDVTFDMRVIQLDGARSMSFAMEESLGAPVINVTHALSSRKHSIASVTGFAQRSRRRELALIESFICIEASRAVLLSLTDIL